MHRPFLCVEEDRSNITTIVKKDLHKNFNFRCRPSGHLRTKGVRDSPG